MLFATNKNVEKTFFFFALYYMSIFIENKYKKTIFYIKFSNKILFLKILDNNI